MLGVQTAREGEPPHGGVGRMYCHILRLGVVAGASGRDLPEAVSTIIVKGKDWKEHLLVSEWREEIGKGGGRRFKTAQIINSPLRSLAASRFCCSSERR